MCLFVCLCAEELTAKLDAEKEAATFTRMSCPHYMEVATIILNK